MFSPIKYRLGNIFNAVRRYSHPTIFSVEINVSCNLRCPECALGGNLIKRKKELLNFSDFKIIADKVKPFCKYMYIMIWGEPLLNKDIILMINYASKFTKTSISTNGMLVTDESAEKIIKSGLTDLIVSVDGASKEVYEKYRVGGDFKKAIHALEVLAYYNNKNGRMVNIIPQFIVFKHNQHEIEKFEIICNTLGLMPSFKSPYIHKGSIFENSDDPFFSRETFDNEIELREAMRKCKDSRQVFTILVDGSVVACCYDYNGILTFGNIFINNVIDIWNSNKYANFRKNVINGKAPGYCVNNCLEYSLCKKS